MTLTNINSYMDRFLVKSPIKWRVGGFTKIPNSLILNPLVNKNGLLVWVILRMHQFTNKDRCFPSLSLLATETRLSRNSVIKGVRLLEKLGYLRIEKRKGRANTYFLANK